MSNFDIVPSSFPTSLKRLIALLYFLIAKMQLSKPWRLPHIHVPGQLMIFVTACREDTRTAVSPELEIKTTKESEI